MQYECEEEVLRWWKMTRFVHSSISISWNSSADNRHIFTTSMVLDWFKRKFPTHSSAGRAKQIFIPWNELFDEHSVKKFDAAENTFAIPYVQIVCTVSVSAFLLLLPVLTTDWPNRLLFFKPTKAFSLSESNHISWPSDNQIFQFPLLCFAFTLITLRICSPSSANLLFVS